MPTFLTMATMAASWLPLTVIAQAAPTQVRSDADRRSNAALATALADDLLTVAKLPGLSIAALDGGRVVYAEGVGYADKTAGRRVDSATVFGSASVAKIVTATAALRLMQDGRFDPDRPVAKVFPSFPGPADRITPRLLAAHLGGIPHYGLGSMPSATKHVWASDALSEFAGAPRVGEPGQRSVYSTHGITLLSAMMEQAVRRHPRHSA